VALASFTAAARPGPAGIGSSSSGSDWGRRIEATVKEQAGDIRRFIVASLDSFAARIINDVREAVPAPEPVPQPIAAAKRPVWPWVTALLAASSMATVCAVFWEFSLEDLRKSRSDLAALASANAELQHSRQDLAAAVKDLTAAVSASAAALSPAAASGAASSRIEPVPYGEIPLDRSRIEALRDFLTRLEAQGFRGVVKITSAAGLFCLSGNSSDGFAPALAALPVSKCDLVGNPFDESLRGQQRQSLAFANLVAGVRQRTAGAISVVIENIGSSHAAAPYPQHNEALTAGEWNRAAASNNRVEFAADPGP
jgi:hypothetical protein